MNPPESNIKVEYTEYKRIADGDIASSSSLAQTCVISLLKHPTTHVGHYGHFASSKIDPKPKRKIIDRESPTVYLKNARDEIGTNVSVIVRGGSYWIPQPVLDRKVEYWTPEILRAEQDEVRQVFLQLLDDHGFQNIDVEWGEENYETDVIYDSGTGLYYVRSQLRDMSDDERAIESL